MSNFRKVISVLWEECPRPILIFILVVIPFDLLLRLIRNDAFWEAIAS